MVSEARRRGNSAPEGKRGDAPSKDEQRVRGPTEINE
jgi:hypothetical protein